MGTAGPTPPCFAGIAGVPIAEKRLRPAVVLLVRQEAALALLGTSVKGRFDREPYYSVGPPEPYGIKAAERYGLQTERPTYFDEFTVAYPRRRYLTWRAAVAIPRGLAVKLNNAMHRAALAGDIQASPPAWSADDRTPQELADSKALLAEVSPARVEMPADASGEVQSTGADASASLVAASLPGNDTPDGEFC